MDDDVMRIAAGLRLGVALVLQSAIISAAVVVLMWTPSALMASVVFQQWSSLQTCCCQ